MPAPLALFGCVLFILWLFVTDRKRHAGVSAALWVPLSWALILGSKPISLWFGGTDSGAADDYLEGSPFDRLVFLLLLVGGILVLANRRVNWGLFFQQNRWVCIFFAYLGISVLWSDYPFVSFKRWIKDAGNLVMILIVLTEARPLNAVKALLARCAYLMIPLSVLFIKYYPQIGRGYNRWPPYEIRFLGVTTDKNLLGMVLYVCGLSLCWILLAMRAEKSGTKDRASMVGFTVLILLTLWLLFNAQSSTALGSTILGMGIIFALRFRTVRIRVKKLGVYGLVMASILLALHLTFNLADFLVTTLGRDLTFTGRTEIWEAVLKEDINPLLGTGYYSFWLGDRVERLSENYYFHLNEAHSGFIETYLNSGWIGVFLLAMVFGSAIKNIRRQIALNSSYGALRFAFLLTSLFYAFTEAIFNRPGLIWFVLLLMFVQYVDPARTGYGKTSAALPQRPAPVKSKGGLAGAAAAVYWLSLDWAKRMSLHLVKI